MYCWFGVQCIPQWISISWEAIGASTTCPSSKEQPRSPPPGWNAAASSRRGTAALRSWAGFMDSSTIARLRPKLSTSEILVSGMYAFSSFTLTSWLLTKTVYVWAKANPNCIVRFWPEIMSGRRRISKRRSQSPGITSRHRRLRHRHTHTRLHLPQRWGVIGGGGLSLTLALLLLSPPASTEQRQGPM